MLLSTLFFMCTSFVQCSTSDLVDYYVQLIKSESAKAHKRQWPTNAYQYEPETTKIIEYGTFDHIIVGAGSAGAVIANRLSEDNFRNVLLLETGDHSNDFSDIPGMAGYLVGMDNNWGYHSVPQNTSCLAMKNRQCHLHRGKGIGGSSMINALMYVRGNKRDYDNWYEQGNYGWSFKDVLPYFKKSENFVDGDPKYHGKGGYLNVEVQEERNAQIDAFYEANRLLGRKEIDYNGEEQIGFGRTQLNIIHGKRHSSGNAFLLPVMKRKNLRILTNSYVIKILINEKKRAVGVLFTKNGRLYSAKSRQDIIISAGVVGSPQLLMLSGIGPKPHLENLGIRVLQDLPVGEHLEDHPSYVFLDFTTNHTEPYLSLEQNVRHYLNGTGILTNPVNVRLIAFLQTKYAKIPGEPDIEILMIPSINSNGVTHKYVGVPEEIFAKPYDPQSTITMGSFLFHPKSRGYMRLKSANPFDYPIIDPQLLSDPSGEDTAVLYESIQLILEIMSTPPFQKLNAKLKRLNLPACEIYQQLSREYWYCFLRQMGFGIFHMSGTCKMGTHPSKGAVVDPDLKVFGISNLRVADTSIIPSSISGHNNAPAMMIGEKAADLVKLK